MPPVDESNVTQIQEDYINILGELIEEGWEYQKAVTEAQKRSLSPKEDLEYHSVGNNLEKLNLRKIISFRNLAHLPVVVANKGWDNLSLQQKEDLLWECGLDSKGYGWRTELCRHRDLRDNLVFDKCVVSNERVDVEWVSLVVEGKSMASLEAKVEASNDRSLQVELRKLGGG